MKILKTTLLSVALMVSLPTSAAWVAYAESDTAWGQGVSMNRQTAINIARKECKKRTPLFLHYQCNLVASYWVNN